MSAGPWLLRLLACLALVLSAPVFATDTGFLLAASSKNWASYFPGQLANGYLSTTTSPRGTEGTPSTLVAFMDYTRDDISRPAAIPGWTEIDYSTGPTHAGQSWLNQVNLDEAHFPDYRQVLNLHDATLTTRYRYVDGARITQVEVTTLVSQAAPHLAATQLRITPEFDGEVQLSFALNLWAPHQPRLPLGRISGDEMPEALVAHGLKIEPVAPSTPDRAAMWYLGDTHVLGATGDAKGLTLQLDGRAEQGLRMAEAVTVGLPAGLTVTDAAIHKSPYRLALNLKARVRKGHSYAFTKFVAFSREGWGGNAADDLALARAARANGFAHLVDAHRAAWHALWKSDVRIDGDDQAQRIVHADLYYLLANTTPGTAWATGGCGMTGGYAGHVFWDSDTWVFPALLLLHPRRAESLVNFRARTLPAAEARAKAAGLRGAKFPWEADPQNGTEQVPYSAHALGEREIHVNADVAIAQWQYYLASGDRGWLAQYGWPVIRDVADFWASRATYVAAKQRYEIHHVTSVLEAYNDVPNDTFTNASARKALDIATAAAAVVGAQADPHWAEVAARLYIPFSEKDRRHLDFDPGVAHDIDAWGDTAVPALAYPSLDVPMGADVRRNDFDYATQLIERSQQPLNSMGLSPMSIAAATQGNTDAAGAWFQRNVTADVIKPPFGVRTETATNNTGYFLTAAGGMLQNIVYGFTGLRLEKAGLVQAYPPMLPRTWHSFTLTHVALRGAYYDITVGRDRDGKVVLTRRPVEGAP
ncbi:MAG TPA: glycoside hydrolase family 65 protein [Frateuria sp.]|uniref:glycoside hydrolase family 65 protein n=1 Tax=Frateuria sp. TaxID=2211372 RepID=UPI002DE2639E|nr:glycoside hydrolase family 65 protein [Frateuria sp.]